MFTTPNDHVAAELRATSARRNVSSRSIARDLGVSQMWVARRMSGQVPIGIDDLVTLAGALDVDPIDVLSDAVGRLASGAAVTTT